MMSLWVRGIQVTRSSPPLRLCRVLASAQGLNPKPKTTLKPSLDESWQDSSRQGSLHGTESSMNATMLTVKPNPACDFTLSTRAAPVHSLSSPTFKLAHASYTTTVGLLARRPLLWLLIRVSVGLTCTARQLFLRPPLPSINDPVSYKPLRPLLGSSCHFGLLQHAGCLSPNRLASLFPSPALRSSLAPS